MMRKPVTGSGGGGGKGGGGGGSTPTESPNTLRSRSTARVVDLIGEGEIIGLVNGAKSIFFDDTPLQNEDGTYNFQNVTWEERFGTPSQDYMRGFSDVEAETAVGVVATNAAPVVRALTNILADAARVTIRLPNGLFQQLSATGDVVDCSVAIAIDIQNDGGSYVEKVTDNITGKTVTPYERAYRIDLEEGTGPWNIRVRRVTTDDQGVNVTNDVSFSSFTTIIDHRLIYPDSAVIGIAVDAEAFGGNVPTRAYEIYGRIVEVPSNYNAETREYTGLWDGTFQLAWTNNPAWIFYDMLMHTRYGLGEYVIDNGTKWDLYPIAQYCDGLVPDGKSGMEPRFTFNGGFQTAEEAYRVMQAMASVFRGMCWWGSNTVSVSADKPTDSSKLVSPANVIGGEFRLAGTALKARHTAVMVAWNDPDDSYRTNIEIVETDDPDLLDRLGWRVTDSTAIACTSQGQAARLGRWILDSEKSETQAVTYVASYDHADVMPGDVVEISDPAFSNVRRAGRVVSVTDDGNSPLTYSTITVDAAETLEDGVDYTLHVTMPDGTLASRALANLPGETAVFQLATPLPIAPLTNSMWSLTGSDVAPRPFRILGVREAEKNVFEITGVFYDETKFARVEEGFKIQPPTFTTIPTGAILPPTNIAISEYLYLAGGVGAKNAVTVSWTASRDPRASFYQVQVQSEDLAWQTKATTALVSADLLDFGSGSYDFRVRALDSAGRPSQWAYAMSQGVVGLERAPDDVENFRVSILGDIATLTWDPVMNVNLSSYQIRFTPELVGATWDSSVLLLDNIKTTSVQVPALTGTYSIKAVTIQGNKSLNAAYIISDTQLFANLNAIAVLQEDPTFAGVKIDTIIDPDYPGIALEYAGDFFDADDFFDPPDFFLLDDGFVAEGYYYFDNSLDLGDVYTSRLTATLIAFAANFSGDFFDQVDFFDPVDFFRVNPEDWSVTLQFRSTNSDPLASPSDFTEWRDFVVGDVTARAFEFRIILRANEYGVTPIVTSLKVNIDMPDRIISEKDLTCTVAGLRVDFIPPFRGLTGSGIAAQDLATGDYYEVSSKDETGFNIIFKDVSDNPVERTFDYVAAGYGRQV